MVLPRLESGARLLDLGACLAQDLRKCIFDGAPADNLYASDLFAEYEDLSYDLWRDRHNFPQGHFIADDILSENDDFTNGPLMQRLGPGQTDIIAITMFLHLFDYQNQMKVATRILRLLSTKPGSMIIGSQAGVKDAMEQELKPPFDKTRDGKKRTVFRHSPSSFTRMWEDAGLASGVPLRISAIFQVPESNPIPVDAGFEPTEKKKKVFGSGEETRRLYFSIIRS